MAEQKIKSTTGKREKVEYKIGNRLAQLRREKGMTQQQFADDFSQKYNKKNPVLITSVSSWERNYRYPTMEVMVQLAQYFDVSIDYLFSLTNEKNSTGRKEKTAVDAELLKAYDAAIANVELINFDGQPVYIRTKDETILEQWGILDMPNNRVICQSESINLSPNIVCYPYATPSPQRTRILTRAHLDDSEYVWIEMKSHRRDVKATYDGRYRHNENHTMLIKEGTGLTLPYEGYDITYWAYKG